MRNEPLISVIIPVYNVEKYLVRCIQSVRIQTYNNLEIILVDDGSSDKSSSICDDFKTKDDRIIVIHKTNGGLSSARNVGIENSRGFFISFIDSDDYVHPRFIEILYNALVDQKADIAMCLHKKTYLNSNILQKKKINEISYTQKSGISAAMEYADEDAYFYICPCNKLYKKSIFDEFRFPEGKLSEDCYVMYKILLSIKSIVVVNERLYYYFQNKHSIMHYNDDISDYNFEAYSLYSRTIKRLVSKEDYGIIKLKIIYKMIDFLAEDYWKAYRLKDYSRMKFVYSRFKKYYKRIIEEKGQLKLKYRILNYNKSLYILARDFVEIKLFCQSVLSDYVQLVCLSLYK